MIKSMTGFGRGESSRDDRKFTVEIKSVNHRYFEPSVRMPKKFTAFESAVRDVLKEYMQRGKTDIFITYEDLTQSNVSLKYNESIAAEYVRYYRRISETFGLENDMRASLIGKSPEVFTMEEQEADEKELWLLLETALRQACAQCVDARVREGESLKEDILEKLDSMTQNVDAIEEHSPKIIAAYREKLQEKVQELLCDTQIEESRIATEVILYADKICTDEETVRLRSHIESMRSELLQGGSVGRKLDFIAQEMNREANTILSKANDLTVSNLSIDIKTMIEKIREQIQNIE